MQKQQLIIPKYDTISYDKITEQVRKLRLGNSRCWSVVVYPHYPKNRIDGWLNDVLSARGLTGCLSPLHDEDLDDMGYRKDPHYHLMIHSDRVISAALPLAIDYALNGNFAPVCVVSSEVKMYYYHIHLYNRDKSLYSDTDRTFYNGYVIPAKDAILNDLFQIADNCNNVHELTVFCRAYRIDLIPHIERYFRTLKAFFGEKY